MLPPAFPTTAPRAALCRRLLLAGLLGLWLPPAGAAPASPTLGKIRQTGLITIGYRDDSPPFSYLDAKRQPIGYSLDICQHVVAEIQRRLAPDELEVRRMPVSSATRLPLVANGTVDLECGVTTHNVERQRLVGFSVTTFVAFSRLMVRRDAGVTTLRDLRDQPVVSTLSTTSISYLHALNETQAMNMHILASQDDMEGVRMVVTGRAKAYAMDDVLLRSLLTRLPPADAQALEILPEALTVEPYALVMRRDDPEFKKLVDEVIERLYRSGQMMTLYQRWFNAPIPPAQANLRLPLSDAMRRLMKQPTDAVDVETYR